MDEKLAKKLRDITESAIRTVADTKEGCFIDIDWFVKQFESTLTELIEKSGLEESNATKS